jgi:hypothetical protein
MMDLLDHRVVLHLYRLVAAFHHCQNMMDRVDHKLVVLHLYRLVAAFHHCQNMMDRVDHKLVVLHLYLQGQNKFDHLEHKKSQD